MGEHISIVLDKSIIDWIETLAQENQSTKEEIVQEWIRGIHEAEGISKKILAKGNPNLLSGRKEESPVTVQEIVTEAIRPLQAMMLGLNAKVSDMLDRMQSFISTRVAEEKTEFSDVSKEQDDKLNPFELQITEITTREELLDELKTFEEKYQLSSEEFYDLYKSGQLYLNDFDEKVWAGLYRSYLEGQDDLE